MFSDLLFVFRDTSLCYPLDLRCGWVNPADAVDTLLVQLQYEPIQSPLHEPQAVTLGCGIREQIVSKAAYPGSEYLVVVAVKCGMPADD